MRIEEDIKLDYADVLFRPKRSTLHSRKDVKLKRTYKFKYSNHEWSGVPLMAANMDGVGELQIAEKLAEYEIMTCLTKQHNSKAVKKFTSIKKIGFGFVIRKPSEHTIVFSFAKFTLQTISF